MGRMSPSVAVVTYRREWTNQLPGEFALLEVEFDSGRDVYRGSALTEVDDSLDSPAARQDPLVGVVGSAWDGDGMPLEEPIVHNVLVEGDLNQLVEVGWTGDRVREKHLVAASEEDVLEFLRLVGVRDESAAEDDVLHADRHAGGDLLRIGLGPFVMSTGERAGEGCFLRRVAVGRQDVR